MIKMVFITAGLFFSQVIAAQQTKGFSFVERKNQKQVDVLYNGKLMTAYCFYDSSMKPILFPVNTVDGITVTRSYPYKMIAGERTDHPHHTGIWLNYESVNGLDFWNNSTAIAPGRRGHYGTIVSRKVTSTKAFGDSATLSASAQWVTPHKKVLLSEHTTFYFYVKKNTFVIDRFTVLAAPDTTVVFKDVKDGMFAIRVARELELPSKEKSKFVDNMGNITEVDPSGSTATGMYYSSEGLKGDSVWGTKGRWVMLTGKKDGKDITIGILDHPSNVGYPAYWHARGYGLFSVNPLGRKIFSNGKEELNLTLHRGEQVTFKYRVIIHSSSALTPDLMNQLWAEFEKSYK